MALEYVAAYYSYLDLMEELSDAECGRLFKACLTYGKTGATPELRGNERFVWPGIRSQIDRDAEKYKMRCEQNRNNRQRTSTNVNDRERPLTKSTKTKEKAKENTKAKEKETSPDGDAKKAALSAVMDCYLDRVNPMASPASLEELKAYVEHMGAECCLRAINIALDEKKTTWSYIKAILQNKLSQGVRCIADWDALDAKREEEKKRGAAQSSNAAPSGDGSFHGWRAKSALDD